MLSRDQARRLDRAEQRHLELLRQRHLRAHHVGEDRHDHLHAIDLHDLAHGRDRAFGIALAVLDHERQRLPVDAARLVDVLHGDLDRRHE